LKVFEVEFEIRKFGSGLDVIDVKRIARLASGAAALTGACASAQSSVPYSPPIIGEIKLVCFRILDFQRAQ
jgi:hypothetical protein